MLFTAYSKSGIQSQYVSNYTWDKRSQKAHKCCEKKACIICKQHISTYFAELFDGGKSAFEMRHSLLYFVGMHFGIFVSKFLIHLRAMYASPQKPAWPLTHSQEFINLCHLHKIIFYLYSTSLAILSSCKAMAIEQGPIRLVFHGC